MTTEYKLSQSPRLPENYPAHVERVLAKQSRARKGGALALWILLWLVLALCAFAWRTGQ